uniref:Uncharacterized protein n=1 Tax=Setaria digitata TaxID=48799 RepID=A0A915PXB5_9BILA
MKSNGSSTLNRGSNTSCCCHSLKQPCSGCPPFHEPVLKASAWKPEKIYVFHCNDCGGTTLREIRSLYIDGGFKRSDSLSSEQNDWQCRHCGFLNPSSDTAPNILPDYKNTSSFNAENPKNLTGCFQLNCKHKRSKQCDKNVGEYLKSCECDYSTVSKSQIKSPLVESKVGKETGKCMRQRESEEKWKSGVVAEITKHLVEIRSSLFADYAICSRAGSEGSLDSSILMTPVAVHLLIEGSPDHRAAECNAKTDNAFRLDPLETAREQSSDMEESRIILRTAQETSGRNGESTASLTNNNISLKPSSLAVMINKNDAPIAKSTTATDGSSHTGYTYGSNFLCGDLKVGRSEKEHPIDTVISSQGQYLMQSSTLEFGSTSGSSQYRTSGRSEKGRTIWKRCTHALPYMAPTVSSAMKMSTFPERSSLQHRLISEGVRSTLPSKQARKTLWQQVTPGPLPKACCKERLTSTTETEPFSLESVRANKSNQQHTSQGAAHSDAFNYDYLKQLFRNRMTLRYPRSSRKDRFMKQERSADSAMNLGDQQSRTPTHLDQSGSQKSLGSDISTIHSDQQESPQSRSGRHHLWHQYEGQDEAPTSDLHTAQVKTSLGWQRTFSGAPCKISRLDRFASQLPEILSSQLLKTKLLQQNTELGELSVHKPTKITKSVIWQQISSGTPQKVGRSRRFSRPGIRDTGKVLQPFKCSSRFEKFANLFLQTESGGLFWIRSYSKQLPKISRFDRFPAPDFLEDTHHTLSLESVRKNFRGSSCSERAKPKVLSHLPVIQSPLWNASESCTKVTTTLGETSSWEQAKAASLPKVSSKSSRSISLQDTLDLHTAQKRPSKTSSTETSSEDLVEKRLTLKSSPEFSIHRFSQKNASNPTTNESQKLEAVELSDIAFYGGSLWRRSKLSFWKTSRSERFQKRSLSHSPTVKAEPSIAFDTFSAEGSERRRTKTITKPMRRTRFDRFHNSGLLSSCLLRPKRLFALNPSDTSGRLLRKQLKSTPTWNISSSGEPLRKRSKASSAPKISLKENNQSRFQSAKYFTHIWNTLTAEPVQNCSRTKRFQNSIVQHMAQIRSPSSPLLRREKLWMRTEAARSEKISRFRRHCSNFQEITRNISNSSQEKDMETLDRSCRFERLQESSSPNAHMPQFVLRKLSVEESFKKRNHRRPLRKTSHTSFSSTVPRKPEGAIKFDTEGVQAAIVEGAGSHTASIQLHGTYMERITPGNIVSVRMSWDRYFIETEISTDETLPKGNYDIQKSLRSTNLGKWQRNIPSRDLTSVIATASFGKSVLKVIPLIIKACLCFISR